MNFKARILFFISLLVLATSSLFNSDTPASEETTDVIQKEQIITAENSRILK